MFLKGLFKGDAINIYDISGDLYLFIILNIYVIKGKQLSCN
jgi:hypothetical protein